MGLDEDLEILMRVSDPLRAQMIKDVLEQDGIVVATPGLQHQALLGGVIDIVIRVPRSELRRAQQLVAAFDSAPIADQESEEGDGDDDDDDALAGPGLV